MADVKISGLPASTTPLAGTEVLPIVQGGQTRQVSVTNLTAGKYVTASSVSIGNTTDPGATNLSVTGSISSGSRAITKASMPAGTVLQVVNATYATLASTTTTAYADTGLTASITPTSATSKILVLTNINGIVRTAGNAGLTLQIVRNATAILQFENSIAFTNSTGTASGTSGANYLDSPATTSAITYKIQFGLSGVASTPTIYINYSFNNASTSTITLLEIAQ